MINSDILELFKVGDDIIINKCPDRWFSELNKNCPIRDDIYPYKTKITNIIEVKNDYVAFTDGYYGWSLSNLLKHNNIITLKELRLKKLEKLKIHDNKNSETCERIY